MAKNNDNTIAWVIIGIVALILVVKFVPLHFPFAVQQTTVCTEGIADYYSLDGNLIDLKGRMDATSISPSFSTGKINQGFFLNGSNYITFPAFNSSLNAGYWVKNSTTDWTYVTGNANILTNNFGLGLINTTVDEIVVGNNVSVPFAVQPCYTQTVVENISCRNYLKSTVTDVGYGCINYSGAFYPNCQSNFIDANYYISSNGQCSRVFFCEDKVYSSFASCNATLLQTSSVVSTTTTTTSVTTSGFDFNKELFKIGSLSVTPLILLIALIIISGLIYLVSKKK